MLYIIAKLNTAVTGIPALRVTKEGRPNVASNFPLGRANSAYGTSIPHLSLQKTDIRRTARLLKGGRWKGDSFVITYSSGFWGRREHAAHRYSCHMSTPPTQFGTPIRPATPHRTSDHSIFDSPSYRPHQACPYAPTPPASWSPSNDPSIHQSL
ncbi:hypothetical protein BDN71DRAFT_96365 [Pleurotus eryngii]|uniref:Uncharacterized protein n=1 Tax=Pleurotus eryngii TaxID=5323 RepID=A0A9P6DBY5_PLEER|nr:hypothetical protein BDN71DRAFT_96365 [Pleurotus eryngii]